MSAPIFYRLNLESLTPDTYNAYLADDIESYNENDDRIFGSVNEELCSYIFDLEWYKVKGLCDAINTSHSLDDFKSYLKANSIFDNGYGEEFYQFATIPQSSYIVAVRGGKHILGIGQFFGQLYYDDANAPYDEVDSVLASNSNSTNKRASKKTLNIGNNYIQQRRIYPYCRHFKWLRIFTGNKYALRDSSVDNFSRITSINALELLQNLLDFKDETHEDYIDHVKPQLITYNDIQDIDPVIPCPFPHNRIFFGAPGTGKSYLLEEQRKEYFANPERYERVTFHPDYSYANFVGTYKPMMVEHNGFEYKDEKQKKIISILTDKTKTAQEKYDLLYKDFQDSSLTRLPILVGIYSDGPFKTKKVDETFTNNNNDVERNHGKAIRPYLNLNFDDYSRSEISYEYVPGPFMRIYVEALKNPEKLYLLAIEEINRANVAAVFGDVFQLLDRDDNGNSMYPIHASEDMKRYLAKELGGDPKDYASIRIPSNMYIWATMNSADQGVFPMDTAFKRRWEFEYIGINTSEQQMSHYNVQLGQGEYAKIINWNDLRKAINAVLVDLKVNEDKLMGPFFLSDKIMKTLAADPKNNSTFIAAFKNKVLMYLFDDAAKQKRSKLFNLEDKDILIYSSICEEFDQKGIAIFCDDISNRFIQHDDNEQ